MILHKISKLSTIIICILFSNVVTGKSFQLERGDFNISLPNNWESSKDLFGFPVVLLGKDLNDSRSVIGITPTGHSPDALGLSVLKNSFEEYKNTKTSWIKKRQGKTISFSKLEYLKWNGIEEGHSLGHEYLIGNKYFFEKSYYLVCKGKVFNLKSIVRINSEDSKSASEKIVRSFSCL